MEARTAVHTELLSLLRQHGRRIHYSTGTSSGCRIRALLVLADAQPPRPGTPSVKRTTLRQILAALDPADQATLQTLAATGSYQDAAAALGVTRKQFGYLIIRARRQFFTLWHEGETPSKQWRMAGRDPEVYRRTGLSHDRARCRCAACARLRLSHAIDAELRAWGSDATVLRVLIAQRGWTPDRALAALAERARPGRVGLAPWPPAVPPLAHRRGAPQALLPPRSRGGVRPPVAVLLAPAAQHPEVCGASVPDPAAATDGERVAVPA
jgi:hypothetical protein